MDTSPRTPVLTEADATTMWSTILESVPAHGRSLWLAFADTDRRPQPALTQIDGLALFPDPKGVTNLGRVVRAILDDDDRLAGALLCLERAGTLGASPFEERWADALTTELGALLLVPVMVRTPKGVSRVPLWTSSA